MKRIMFTCDDETFNLLEGDTNKSDTIRKSIKVYKSAILPDTIEGFRLAFTKTQESIDRMEAEIKDINSKLDYFKHHG